MYNIKIAQLSLNVIRNLPLNPKQVKKHLCNVRTSYNAAIPCGDGSAAAGGVKKQTNTPHPPKDPPDGYNPTTFNHKSFEAPDFLPFSIFRQFASPEEKLGPGASKCGKYRNPEYFSFHRFSFAEMQRSVEAVRAERAKDQGAICLYEPEEGATTSSRGDTEVDDPNEDDRTDRDKHK